MRVQLSGTDYLNLAEVQVFGTTSAPATYSISGQVSVSGTTLNGVTMNLTGSQTASVATSGSGNYSFSALAAGGSYTITPVLAGYTFVPPSQTFNNLSANQTFNFSASAVPATYSISGRISVGTSGLPGVSVALSGTQTNSTTTDSSGGFILTGLTAGGNYTVTPLIPGYIFNPPNQTFSNLSANVAANFSATLATQNNVALGKPATQSSTLIGYAADGASSAVDGNSDGNFMDGSVTHTNVETNAWWQVDLGAPLSIASITIWNRTDCCSDRLGDYWVFVSNTPFGPNDTPLTLSARPGTWNNHQTTYPNPSTTIAVNVQGRYVRVQLSGYNALSLAEVQVFGSASAPVSYGISGQITASGAPLNGVTMSLTGTESMSATTAGSGNYAFSGLAAAGTYTVTPTLNGYSFSPPAVTFSSLSANQTATFIASPTTGSNLALGKTAAQSSTLDGFGPTSVPSSAIDGNTDGNFFDGSVSHTNFETNPWWQVDLGSTASITSIAVWNRTDCCSDRLGDYWVFVSNTPFGPTDTPVTLQGRSGTWSSHQTTFPNPSTSIPVNAQGRYVRIQLNGTNYLSLAEVQVFGQ